MTRVISAVFTAAALILVAGIAQAQDISADTAWSGTVRLSGMTIVQKGATLTIAPGTKVEFEPAEQDETGLAGSGMTVYGRIIARGVEGGRITFTSAAAKPAPGDWGEIKVMASDGSEFTGCDFRYGGWGIHVHDSVLKVQDCSFTDNAYGGIRGKGGDIDISGSRFTGMEIGIRYWQGSPSIHGNTITDNETGIFFRKDCEGSKLTGNDIYGNSDYDLKLGDAQEKDIDVSGNWWGTTDTAEIRKKIYDRDRDEYVGRALIEPVLKDRVVPAGR